MTTEFKVEVIAKETIRLSSPTPDHLKNFKLSVFDQLSPIFYTSILLFNTSSTSSSSPHRSSRLKSSLSKVLSCFYPLAGRIRDNLYIDRDDGGAEFIEAKVYCPLSHIFDRPCPTVLHKLLPIDIESLEASTGLLLVQANTFGCGGLAVGVYVSHKIADASTLSTSFIKGWSAAALLSKVNAGIEIPSLDMMLVQFSSLAELFATSHMVVLPKARCTIRRYVLNPTEITLLDAGDAVLEPTWVEAVVALMWRCVARTSKKNDPVWRSLLSQAINLRGWLPELLPKTMVGNLVRLFKVEIAPWAEKSEMELKKVAQVHC